LDLTEHFVGNSTEIIDALLLKLFALSPV